MKKTKRLIAILLVMTLLLGLGACGGTDDGEDVFSVGLVFSSGGRGDNGINDMMYGAMETVALENGWSFSSLENETASNVEPANRQYCEQGIDVIINFGYGCIDVVNKLAVEYPEIIFITIDAVTDSYPNVKNYTFKEYEGSFLVGAVAGLMTETDTIGFIGAQQNEMIEGFEAGYTQGAQVVNPDINVLVGYIGSTVDAYADPVKGKEIAISHYDSGADICFAAAGSSGIGMFEAAIQRDLWAIGVDVDQSEQAPDNTLSSMIKRCDVAIIEALEDIAAGKFESGSIVMGIAEGGVDYVYSDFISADIVSAVDALKAQVIAGDIVVNTIP